MTKFKSEVFTVVKNEFLYTIMSQKKDCICFNYIDFWLKIDECDEETLEVKLVLKKKISEQEFSTLAIYMRTNSEDKFLKYVERYIISHATLLPSYKIKPENKNANETVL
jgi:formyltetrahydrofolate hydrolase